MSDKTSADAVRTTGFFLGIGTFVLVALPLVVGLYGFRSDILERERFNVLTNIFLLWPFVAVVFQGAWLESTVFLTATLVSINHHACTGILDGGVPIQANLVGVQIAAASTGLGLLLLAGLVLYAVARYTRTPISQRALATYVFFVVVNIAIVIVYVVGDTPCFGGVPRIWSIADVVTAASVAVLVGLYVLRLHYDPDRALFMHNNDVFAVFYFSIILTLLFKLYNVFVGSSFEVFVYVLLGGFGLLIVIRLIALCVEPSRERKALLAELSVADLIIFAAVGGIAIGIFAFDNHPSTHPWWHVLGGFALFVAIFIWSRHDAKLDQTTDSGRRVSQGAALESATWWAPVVDRRRTDTASWNAAVRRR